MSSSQHRLRHATILACLLVSPCLVHGGGDTAQQDALSARFAEELSKNGEVEITAHPEYCYSGNRSLHLNQEMTEVLARAIQYSTHIRVDSECEKVITEEEHQFCRFYFYSPNKSEQWTAGVSFLVNPNSGRIKVDSIQCFSTP